MKDTYFLITAVIFFAFYNILSIYVLNTYFISSQIKIILNIFPLIIFLLIEDNF